MGSITIMMFIIQTHCHLPQLLSYSNGNGTATNFLSAMLSKAAD